MTEPYDLSVPAGSGSAASPGQSVALSYRRHDVGSGHIRMRLLFRSMKADNGHPAIESSARGLGVRVGVDVQPDASGDVGPGGGMSVAPDDPLLLAGYRRPKEFGGSGRDPVWEIRAADLPTATAFVLTSPDHGQIEPSSVMPLEDYQRGLESTQEAWIASKPPDL